MEKHWQLPFGSYAQLHEDPMLLNDINNERTVGVICLVPVSNSQGGYKFLNLNTGRRMRQKQWTLLPIPDNVILQVKNMGK
eukprot:13304251-Ditylum_brightwellii.AAC.1